MFRGKLTNKLVGIGICICYGYFVYHNIRLWYLYHFTEGVLFAFRIPDYELFINILLGIIGLFVGIATFLIRISVKKGVYLSLLLVLVIKLIEITLYYILVGNYF